MQNPFLPRALTMARFIHTIFWVLMTSNVQAQSHLQTLADIETKTHLAQKQLALMQANAAIAQFKGMGTTVIPQIISLYSSKRVMRALVDLGPSGIKDVGQGDVIGPGMTVSNIDMESGVRVAMQGSKSTFYLAMKSAPLPSTSPQAQPGQPSAQPPGYALNTSTFVPPLQPFKQ
ncbi:hypothetical protein [Delftia sp. GW456-R20]|uniref:hypothetical protein n=1 Tax=Delftia sp. GW456-R20 TaxID=1827145 RepID=UPI0012E949B3|nr:hypothetical protein [Delftia sp. GW456-R20]